MSDWRNIWKKSIATCQKAIGNKNVEEEFSALRNSVDDVFKNDKMIDFEEGIAYECIGEFDKAIEIYSKVCSPEGLPVKHWRNRAAFFKERTELKKNGKIYADNFADNYVTLDHDEDSTLEKIQWDAFYYLHSFIYIPSHIQYLAISSMARIDSEPEMAILIFRVCLEDIIRIMYPNEYEDNKKTLGPLIVKLFNDGILFTKGNNKKLDNDLCMIIKERGDNAAHGNVFDYSNIFICDTIIKFIDMMKLAEANIWLKKTSKR